jgi:hypothetical protein
VEYGFLGEALFSLAFDHEVLYSMQACLGGGMVYIVLLFTLHHVFGKRV